MSKLRNRWAGLVVASLAISLIIIDGTILNTIFPSIINSLNLNSTDVQWTQESYVVVFASLLLVWGSLADRFGRRFILLLGLGVFIAASVRAGFAPDATTLVVARAFQGLGGAMVLPTTLSLVNANFSGKERGIAFAVWGSTIGGMVAVGPVLGGWLATHLSWNWAFLVNVPIGLLLIFGILIFIPESKDFEEKRSIDFGGAAVSAIFFGALVFTLIEGRLYGWIMASQTHVFRIGDFTWPITGFSVVAISIVVTLISGAAFVLIERNRAKLDKHVILDFALLKIGSFRNGSIAALIVSMGEFGLIFVIPLWLQNLLGLSPISTGLALLWLAGGSFLAAIVAGLISNRFKPMAMVQLGLILEVIGVIGIAVFASNAGGWTTIAAPLLVYGIGVGLATAQLTNVIMVDIPEAKVGQASGMQSSARQIGSALGIAVLGSIFFGGIQSSIESRVFHAPSLSSIAETPRMSFAQYPSILTSETSGAILSQLDALLVKQNVPTEIAVDVKKASMAGFEDGVRGTAGWAALFLGLGLLSTLNLTRRRKVEQVIDSEI